LILRAGRDDDAAAVIALITSCWSEYPGVYMDVDGENPELRSLASYFSDADGAFWVAEDVGGLKGMVATRPSKGASWELCRMYVSADARGTGLANDLVRGRTRASTAPIVSTNDAAMFVMAGSSRCSMPPTRWILDTPSRLRALKFGHSTSPRHLLRLALSAVF
jgi:hypothetical protein